MTGYFSALARQTGLTFAPRTDAPASPSATVSPAATPSPESTPAVPLIEVVTFASQPVPRDDGGEDQTNHPSQVHGTSLLNDEGAPAGRADQRAASEPPSTDTGDPRRVAAIASTSTEARHAKATDDPQWLPATTDSVERHPEESPGQLRIEPTALESSARTTQDASARIHVRQVVSPTAQGDGLVPASHAPGPEQPVEIVEGRPALARHGDHGEAPRSADRSRDRFPPARTTEPGNAARDAHIEREVRVHSYLREVAAWVAAPPETDRPLEREPQAEPLRGSTGVATLERDLDVQASPRPGGFEAPAVQDLTLSIGTISVVIEEPKASASTQPQPPAVVPRLPERAASEPPRLSRYYLGRW